MNDTTTNWGIFANYASPEGKTVNLPDELAPCFKQFKEKVEAMFILDSSNRRVRNARLVDKSAVAVSQSSACAGHTLDVDSYKESRYKPGSDAWDEDLDGIYFGISKAGTTLNVVFAVRSKRSN